MKKVLKKSLMLSLCLFSFSIFAETLSESPVANPSFVLTFYSLDIAEVINQHYDEYPFTVHLDENHKILKVTANSEDVSFKPTYSEHGILMSIEINHDKKVFNTIVGNQNGIYQQEPSAYSLLIQLPRNRPAW